MSILQLYLLIIGKPMAALSQTNVFLILLDGLSRTFECYLVLVHERLDGIEGSVVVALED